MVSLTVISFFNLITMCSLQETPPLPPTNISNTTSEFIAPSEIKDIMRVMDHITDTFIDKVNGKTNGNWTAGNTFTDETSLQDLRRLASKNPVIDPQNRKFYMLHRKVVLDLLPSNFSVLNKWPKCGDLIVKVPKKLSTKCSMGWVITMVSVLTDRLCIISRGTHKTELSPVDIFQCCTKCSPHDSMCEKGGDALMAWDYWMNNGVVSGNFSGDNNTGVYAGCKPYNNDTLATTSCNNECAVVNAGLNRSKYAGPVEDSLVMHRKTRYKREKLYYTFGKNLHVLPHQDTKFIKCEILRNGPVQTAFKLYEDFFVYSSGVYEHVHGEYIGYHSVKLIGWGKENGIHYWLIVNIWGEKFGINGTAKFRRGINHCEIEENAIALDYTRLNKSTWQTREEPIHSASHLVNTYHTHFFIIAFIVYTAL